MTYLFSGERSIVSAMAVFLVFASAGWTSGLAANGEQTEPDDAYALRDVSVGKVVFDINTTEAKDLELYLSVIVKTHDDFLRQDVKPDIILAFRGYAVTFISSDRKRFDTEQHETLDLIAEHINRLSQKGVRMESCVMAMRGLSVGQDTLLTGITTVGNAFVSLTGYQMKDYAIIPIY